jgi:hypothetical protein
LKAPKVNVAALVDQAGRLKKEIAALRGKEEKLKLIQGEIIAALALKPDQERTVSGTEFTALVGIQAIDREVTDKLAIFTALGRDRYLDLSRVPLGELDKALPKEFVEGVTSSSRTGRREWKYLPGRLAKAA